MSYLEAKGPTSGRFELYVSRYAKRIAYGASHLLRLSRQFGLSSRSAKKAADWLSAGSSVRRDELRPSLHQPTAFLEEVCPLVGELGLVAHGVRDARFDDFAGNVGLVGRPIAE